MQLVVAVDQNWQIGYQGELLFSIAEDLRNFRRLTEGTAVVMGRLTMQGMPGGRPLPNRENYILSRDKKYTVEGATVLHAIEDIILLAKKQKVSVIGGAEIYRQLLPYCQTAFVTKVERAVEASDSAFPNLDQMPQWFLQTQTAIQNGIDRISGEEVSYTFCTYTQETRGRCPDPPTF